MVAFVTALESSMRRLLKLLAHKTNTDHRLLRISIEMVPVGNKWALFVRRVGYPDIILETQDADLVSLVGNTLIQVERELAERRDHCRSEAQSIDILLQEKIDDDHAMLIQEKMNNLKGPP